MPQLCVADVTNTGHITVATRLLGGTNLYCSWRFGIHCRVSQARHIRGYCRNCGVLLGVALVYGIH